MSGKRKSPVPKEAVAEALAFAETQGDASVAQRYGVTADTLQGWRRRAEKDPELAAAVRAAKKAAVGAWRDEAAQTFVAISRGIRRSVNGREEVSFALIAAAKTYGAICIESDALLGEDVPGVATDPPGLRVVSGGKR